LFPGYNEKPDEELSLYNYFMKTFNINPACKNINLFSVFIPVFILVVSGISPVLAADIFKGQEIYMQNCQICHGPDGRPVVYPAPNFALGEGIIKPDMELLDTIRIGKGAMPAFRGIVRDIDILNVIGYLRTLQN
jgi:cytochrome c6